MDGVEMYGRIVTRPTGVGKKRRRTRNKSSMEYAKYPYD